MYLEMNQKCLSMSQLDKEHDTLAKVFVSVTVKIRKRRGIGEGGSLVLDVMVELICIHTDRGEVECDGGENGCEPLHGREEISSTAGIPS